MKPRLLILSDLWGQTKSHWIQYYIAHLEDCFEIVYYDCCKLGGIDTKNYKEDTLHQQFVEGGIDLAVQNLIKQEPKASYIIGFSIGGTIGWKYSLQINTEVVLYTVSSTRLRYETNSPKGKNIAYFGENDLYKPDKKWIDKINIDVYIKDRKGHEFYKEPSFAQELSKQVCKTKSKRL